MRRKRHSNTNHGTAVRERRAEVAAAGTLLPLIVASAYVMATAVAAPKLPWLGCVALVPLLRAIQVQRPLTAMAGGAIWGASLFAFGATIVDTAIVPTALTLILLTVAPACYAYLGARLTRRIGFSPFVLSVGWMLLELSFAPLGLRRGLLAGTQGDGPLVGVVGQLLGYVLVAFVVAYTSALLLSILSGVRFRFVCTIFTAGLDEAGTCLWRLIPIMQACAATGPSHPRAPPAW